MDQNTILQIVMTKEILLYKTIYVSYNSKRNFSNFVCHCHDHNNIDCYECNHCTIDDSKMIRRKEISAKPINSCGFSLLGEHDVLRFMLFNNIMNAWMYNNNKCQCIFLQLWVPSYHVYIYFTSTIGTI